MKEGGGGRGGVTRRLQTSLRNPKRRVEHKATEGNGHMRGNWSNGKNSLIGGNWSNKWKGVEWGEKRSTGGNWSNGWKLVKWRELVKRLKKLVKWGEGGVTGSNVSMKTVPARTPE